MVDSLDELRVLFASVLEIEAEDLDEDTDFFLAGGHSLLALQLAVAVEKRCGVELRVRDIAECPTPRELATRLKDNEVLATEPPELVEPPVDPGVRWLWIERQSGQVAPSAYNVPGFFRLRGVAEEARLKDAVAALHQQHPNLRAVFTETDGEPTKEVASNPPHFTVIDLAEHPNGESALDDLVDAEVTTPFDVAKGPLLRTTLFRHRDRSWSILFVADHLICDGRGLAILAHDLVSIYADPSRAAPILPGDTSLDTAASLAYWAEQLAPQPEPLPLPVCRTRDRPVGRTEIVSTEIPEKALRDMDSLARSANTSRFVVCTAAVARALAQLTGSEDVCVGTPVDLRSRKGSTESVGCHVATVPLRLTVGPNAEPQELITEVSGRIVDAIDHSQVPFAELVGELRPSRQPFRPPYFDVWVALYPHIDTNAQRVENKEEISLYGGPVPLREGMFELSFQFVEHPAGVRLDIQFDVHRYDIATVRRMADRARDCLEWLTLGGDSGSAETETRPLLFEGFRL